MVDVMVTFGGLSVELLGVKLISMGYDGKNVFQGENVNVTTQMKKNTIPLMIGMYCFAHQTNLVVGIIFLRRTKILSQRHLFLSFLSGFF
jgi:hypothetical protein